MATQSRNFTTTPMESRYSLRPKQWAIIVGISKYKHEERWKLDYAARDAEALFNLIQTPSGGAFEKERICQLFDEDATTANVLRALRSFLKKPAPEDLVLIYFACHGGPDPERLDNLYLLTYDTDPNEIAWTALRMSEIRQALEDTLHAMKVVIIADTCHSAAIAGGGRSTENAAAVTNRYLDEVRKAKSGIAYLTSAQGNEVSLEGQRWDEHGVFTHYLLQGMQGNADGYSQAKDGMVTVGELFDYVRDQVQKATDDHQHPAIGINSYDRNLVMAITGGIDAQDHYQLGCWLYELGWLLDDAGRFAAASRQFDEAIRWSRANGTSFREAELGLGKSLSALRDYEGAIQVLQTLADWAGEDVLPEAWLYLGMARARLGAVQRAQAAFEQLIVRHPQHELAAWVGEYAEALRAQQTGKKYALLVGINEYEDKVGMSRLRGSLNDVAAMQQLLTQQYGFDAGDIVTLTDAAATHQAISEALQALAGKSMPEDSVVVHFSGIGLNGDTRAEMLYLAPYDLRSEQDGFANGIEYTELHTLMCAILARRKALLLDTIANARFVELVRLQPEYVLLVAASLGQEASEYVPGHKAFAPNTAMEVISEEVAATSRGTFSFVLGEQLAALEPHTFTLRGLEEGLRQKCLALGYESQTPLIIGNEDRFPFVEDQFYPKTFEFALRRNFGVLSLDALQADYARFRARVSSHFAQAYHSFGCAFLEKGSDDQAKEALQIALDQCNGQSPAAILALFKQQVNAGELEQAFADLRDRVQRFEDSELASQIQTLMAVPATFGRHALLIGIDHYPAAGLPSLRGAVNDAEALRQLLLTHFGFQLDHITMLTDGQATRDAILAAFQQLVEQARVEPAIFFFAGYGSIDEDGAPILVSVDWRQESVLGIHLEELAQLAPGGATNLVTMIDAGCLRNATECVAENRSMPVGERPGTRSIRISGPIVESERTLVGAIAIYSWLIGQSPDKHSGGSFFGEMYKEREIGQAVHGGLTAMLLECFNAEAASKWTYEQWIADCKNRYPGRMAPLVLGDYTKQTLVSTRPLQNKLLKTLTELDQRPAYQIVELLPRLLEKRHDRYPEGYLNLGIAYGMIGDADKAIPALEEALDPNEPEIESEARYHLGRILFESKQQLGRAVTELELAIERAPKHRGADCVIRAHYYRGQAIRAVVERETLVEAERMLGEYLRQGAPLGHGAEVVAFLTERDPEAQKRAALEAGLAFAMQDEFEKSKAAFEKAIALGALEGQIHLGRVLFMLEDYTGAANAMQRAIKQNGNNGEAQYYLGEALRLQEENRLAEKAFAAYLQSNTPIFDVRGRPIPVDVNTVREFLAAKNYRLPPPSTR